MLVEIYRYVIFHSHETVQLVVVLLILALGMIAIIVMISKKNAQLSSVAFFDPLTKWGNKRFLDEVFLPQLLLEANSEAEGVDKDEAIHFMHVRLDKMKQNIKKQLEKDILVKHLAANIKKYLLHPADQCFRIDESIFLVVITRKKINKEESDLFLKNMKTAADDLILIYPKVESVVSMNILSWEELDANTLDSNALSVPTECADDEIEQEATSSWVNGVLQNFFGKKVCTQLLHTNA